MTTQQVAPAHERPSRERLSDGDVYQLKPEGWWGDDGKLFRVFEFASYRAGVDFAVQVAQLAEQQDHHPDIHIFYDRVKVNYFTHDRGGVTLYDVRGAAAVNALFDALPQGIPAEMVSEPVS